VVHLIRHSLRFVAYREKKKVASDLRAIYTAPSAEAALSELEQFAGRWDEKFPMISASWKANWELVSPFLAFPPELRRVVYTTNTIEALNRQIRKTIKTRGQFPTDDAARKLLYLAIINAEKKWHQTYNWTSASAAFKIHFADRYPH
jgi:putative transposase